MFETVSKAKKLGATVGAAGALAMGVGAEQAQAHPAPLESSTPAIAGPNAVGAVSAGADQIEKHHHFMSPGLTQRLQTDPTRGYEGGKGADLNAPDQEGKGHGELPQKGGDPSGSGPRAGLSAEL